MIKLKTAAALAVLAIFSVIPANAEYNEYNNADYVNVSNRTLAEVADDLGMTVVEFLEVYGLPSDMASDTNETAAYYYLTMGSLASLYDLSFDDLKKQLSLDDSVTADMCWGDVEAEIPIKNYSGGNDFEDLKAAFGLDESVTEDSQYGEIRIPVERAALYYGQKLSYFKPDSILVMLNGKYLDLDTEPLIINERIMLPMRTIFEALGAEVKWDGDTKSITAVSDRGTIKMQIGKISFTLNSEDIFLDTPPIIEKNRTLVPVRAISEALDATVKWNDKTKTAVIHK
ncbi:MAG: copper amine oxidase N-terminal domain-containing protein [Firmicutes bacterium]|nr:copper amine oxidase N-terminal domain-containing protein [Bacillota bacterium]